jgi:hypothetical protein
MEVFCKLYSFFKPKGNRFSKSVPITLVSNRFTEFRIIYLFWLLLLGMLNGLYASSKAAMEMVSRVSLPYFGRVCSAFLVLAHSVPFKFFPLSFLSVGCNILYLQLLTIFFCCVLAFLE